MDPENSTGPSTAARLVLVHPWTIAAVVITGLLASAYFAHALRVREQSLFRSEFEHRALERARMIERELVNSLDHVRSVAALVTVSGSVDRAQFSAFARAVLEDHPGLQGLGFNPVVTAAQRAAHERDVRAAGIPDYRVTERSPDGRLVPAEDREMYVVATLLEPMAGNEAALGFDIASEPVRRAALNRARDSGQPAMTGRLRLVQETEDQFGVLICVPVYAYDAADTVERRRAGLLGYAVGIIRIGDVVDQALSALRPTGIHLLLTDETAPAAESQLHVHRSRTLSSNDVGSDAVLLARREPQLAYGFDIAGRRWRVRGSPTASYRAAAVGWGPVGAMGVGLLITGLLGGYLIRQRAVNARLQRAITQRLQAEERQAGFGRVLDEAHDEIYVFHAESLCFLHVNRGARENLGFSMDELREMTPLDLKPDLTPAAFVEVLRPLREGQKQKVEFTTTHRRKDGTRYDVDVNVQLSKFDAVPAFVAVILDITERKQFEEHLHKTQRLEALGTLAGGIAHDFNNLLTAIMGHTELSLAEVPAGSQLQAKLSEVIRASERARDVVRRILAFSRGTPVERRPIDLRELVTEVLKLMRGSLPVTIAIHEDLDGACRIEGDPTQIHQVLVNLCTNAAHAMREHEGVLHVRLSRVERRADDPPLADLSPGRYARISVQDSGTGIPPEIIGRIFDPFFSTKKPGEGTGMGLAVAHGIVRGHGGALTVRSEVDRGTTFDVYLPRVEARVPGVLEPGDDRASAGESILVVDDEAAIVNLMTEMLSRAGYQVEAYSDSREALAAVRERPRAFDLVITDYTMPGMTGVDLARELKRVAPRVAVVLMSGYGDLVGRDELRASGIRELVTKPVRLHELETTIRRCLQESASLA